MSQGFFRRRRSAFSKTRCGKDYRLHHCHGEAPDARKTLEDNRFNRKAVK
jgi:hypothetical protein